jgi:hypothetical protein
MASWVRRIGKLFSTETRTESATSPKPKPLSQTSAPAAVGVIPLPDLDAALFDWLLDIPPGPERDVDAAESLWLAELDPLIAADKGRGELLPRAAGVIPPLLNSLRDESQSSAELAQRVERDPNLVAEVMRLANSIAFRGKEPVTELAEAVRRVGTSGVKQAIAKVVLKPMFDSQSGGLSSRAAARLWAHSQAQADLCRAVAMARGMDPFEAYLGGLLCNVGWTAGLRALERVFEQHPPAAEPAFGSGFKQGFRSRRDRLFVQLVTAWRVNLVLHEAARDVQYTGSFAAATDPFAQLLLMGHRLASLRMLVSAGRMAEDDALLAGLPDGVRSVYTSLG